MSASQQRSQDGWASRIGVILAVAGSAVGLGNFLRFPGNAAQNGGGAFMLPYFISLLILGIPLCWAEWTMGRYGGKRGFNSSPGIFTAIWPHRAAKYFGAIALAIPLFIYMYYVQIEAWCLGYALHYLSGDLTSAEAAREVLNLKDPALEDAKVFGVFFDQYVGSKEHGALFAAGGRELLWVVIAAFVLNFVLIYRGISKGIESFCKVAMPLMVFCALCVLVRVLTLDPPPGKPDQTVLAGLGFMWNPQPDKLKDPETWLNAASQIFFSLSVGFGIIINYASYLKRDDDVALSGLTASSMNEFFEVCLGGLITIPAAFVFFGLALQQYTASTFGLGFFVLPNVFAQMPAGWFFGFLWFFMLFLAAITSSVSMLQPVIAFLEEGFGLKRHASAAILGLITALGCGYVMYFSGGLVALDEFDFWSGTMLIYVLALFQIILYGWVFGIQRGEQELHEGAHIRIPRLVQWNLKYIAPVFLLLVFGGFCWQKGPDRLVKVWKDSVVFGSVLFMLAVFAFLLVMVHIAGRRWERQGKIKYE